MITTTPWVDEALVRAVRKLVESRDKAQQLRELDEAILKLGPHHVAHFLVTTTDPAAADALREYMKTWWKALLNLVDQLILAARRTPETEYLKSDFGDS